MPECVSCGKEIPAGKFFCEDCYVKMKGKRGPSGELPRSLREQPGQLPAAADAPGADVTPPQAAAMETVVPMVKASGTLTPASSKKVVSMKTGTERAAKEKTGEKRIKVTISLSERTYAALSGLRKGGRAAGQEPGDEADGSEPYQTHARQAPRGGRARGKPKLKAVASPGAAAKPKSGIRKAIAYRDRALDGKDLLALTMAILVVLTVIILCFLPWARISWGAGDGSGLKTVEVMGTDLGARTYLCMGIMILALLYVGATFIFKGIFMEVDYGVVFIGAGLLYLLLLCIFFVFTNARFLVAAVQKAGMSTEYLPAQFELQRLFAAYAMVLMGAILGFAGLVRLSERREVGTGETSG